MSQEPLDSHVDSDQLLTVADIAGHIGAHEGTVRQWIKQGELKATKFSTRIGWRIRRSDYEEFYRRRTLATVIALHLLTPLRTGK
jgi:excisionase family DNA binding protein